jgi:hypothetical protein
MWSDVRYALRTLAKTPMFTITAIAALALGIGANSAIFSVFNGLMLHPAGVVQPDRVIVAQVKYEKLNLPSIQLSAPDFADVRDGRQVFSSAAAMQESDYNFTGGDFPQRLRGAQVSVDWFKVLGAEPAMGRAFRPEEDQPKANHEAILAYSTWKRIFGGDPAIVGKTFQFNQQSYQVVGVMGPEFRWPAQTDLWTPLGLAPTEFAEENRHNEGLFVIARMMPGVSFNQADAYIKLAARRNIEAHNGYAKDSGWGMFAVPVTT